MARCNSCSKFVSYDDPEFEVEGDPEADEGTVTARVTLTMPCGECGDGLKGATFDFEETFEHTCDEDAVLAHLGLTGAPPLLEPAPETETMEPAICAVCGTAMVEYPEESEARKRQHFDAIKGGCPRCEVEAAIEGREFEAEASDPEPTERGEGMGRYRKQFYGVELDVTVTCSACGHDETVHLSDDIQASYMDDLQ